MALIWRATLTIVVSILGLVSCTKDNAPAPKDGWRLTAPVIRLGDEVIVANAAQSSRLTQIPAEAELVFPSLEGGRAKGVILELTFTCDSDETHEVQTLSVREASRIPFKSLLPIRMFKRLQTHKAADVLCNLDVTAKNKIGTTHHFVLDRLNISTLEPSEQIEAFASSQSLVDLPPKLANSGRGQAHLLCELFENHRKLGQMPWADLIRDLTQGPMTPLEADESRLVVLNPASKTDSRILRIRQNCQLVIEAEDPATGLLERWVSPPTLVRFANPSVLIEGGYTLENLFPPNVLHQPVFRVKITNPHPVSLRFSLPLDPGKSLTLQFLYRSGQTYYQEDLGAFRFDFHLEGEETARRDSGNLVFRVPAGGSVNLIARLEEPSICPHFHRVPNDPTVVGYAFGFRQPLPLTLLSQGANGEESVVIPWPFAWPITGPQGLEGWQAFEDWVRVHRSGARPAAAPTQQVRKMCSPHLMM